MGFGLNQDLLPVKGHFFLIFAAAAPVTPFLPILAKQLGISPFGVGIVFAVLPFGGMVGKPIAGWLADCLGQQRIVFLLALLFTGLFYFSIQLVSSIDGDFSATFECSQPQSLLKICNTIEEKKKVLDILKPGCLQKCEVSCQHLDEDRFEKLCSAFSNLLPGCTTERTLPPTTLKFSMDSNLTVHDTHPLPGCLSIPGDVYFAVKEDSEAPIFSTSVPTAVKNITDGKTNLPPAICDEPLALTCSVFCKSQHLQQFSRKDSILESSMFWLFFLLNLMAYSCFTIAVSISDALCFDILKEKHYQYGAQRVWGSIGWGIFTVVAGYLVDTGSAGDSRIDYSPAFLLMAGLLTLDIACAALIRLPPVERPKSVWAGIVGLLQQPRVVVFLFWCFGCGLLTSVIWQWLLWYLSDLAAQDSNSSCDATQPWVTTLLGLNMAVQCFVGEVPMFFLSGWVLRNLGHAHTMSLVLVAFSLRFFLYSLLSDPWLSLPIELLNGVTFGLCYAAMTGYAHTVAPDGMEATVQGIVGAVYEGAGVATGSLIGGAIYQNYGGVFLFRCAGILAFVLAILHMVSQCLLSKSARNSNRNTKVEDEEEPALLNNSDL